MCQTTYKGPLCVSLVSVNNTLQITMLSMLRKSLSGDSQECNGKSVEPPLQLRHKSHVIKRKGKGSVKANDTSGVRMNKKKRLLCTSHVSDSESDVSDVETQSHDNSGKKDANELSLPTGTPEWGICLKLCNRRFAV